MKKNNPELYNSNLIDELLDSISPLEAIKIEKKMLIAAKIDDALRAKGWKNKDLLTALGKSNPSVITKWLSGTHNFTMDTLVELEYALEINLLDIEEKNNTIIKRYHIEVSVPVNLKAPNYLDEVVESSMGNIYYKGLTISSQTKNLA